MRINLFKEAKEYGVPIWKLPDFLLILTAVFNIVVIIISYNWAARFAEDPREAFLLVTLESVFILIVGNIIVESSKKIISAQKIKKEFISIISHQLRSPLTVIKWNIEMLNNCCIKKNLENSKEHIYVERIIDAVEKMSEMANDIINLARLNDVERNLKKFGNQECDFSLLLDEMIHHSDDYAKTKGITFEVDKADRPTIIKADASNTQVILQNLIENAMKYGNENSKIFIKAITQDNQLIFEIKNKGIPIKDSDKENVFSKFYRTDEARKRCSSGTGLGLHISKSLIEKLDGKIWFNSKPNGETTFYFTLPLK